MDGKGVYNYATGEKYEGDWADGKMEGKGALQPNLRRLRICEWR